MKMPQVLGNAKVGYTTHIAPVRREKRMERLHRQFQQSARNLNRDDYENARLQGEVTYYRR